MLAGWLQKNAQFSHSDQWSAVWRCEGSQDMNFSFFPNDVYITQQYDCVPGETV